MLRPAMSVALSMTLAFGPCMAQVSVPQSDLRQVSGPQSSLMPVQEYERLRRLAETDPQAAYQLGKACEAGSLPDGRGVDNSGAVFWYEKSAKGGYVPATYNLGWMVSEGTAGVPDSRGEIHPDRATGVRYMKWAVAQGYQERTGTMGPKPEPEPEQKASSSSSDFWTVLVGIGIGAAFLSSIDSKDTPAKTQDSVESSRSSQTSQPAAPVTCIRYRDEQVPNPKGSMYPYITKSVQYTAYGVHCQ